MFNKGAVLFLACILCSINGQYDLDDVCETDEGEPGICRYEQTCKYARENKYKQIHESECGNDDRTTIVCCPADSSTGVMRSLFVGTNGYISNSNMTCHYDGYIPMMCCPNPKDDLLPEPKGCPRLPHIQTPEYENPAHKVAWEKCVDNQKYVDVCEQEGNSYTRHDTCAIPSTSQRVSGGQPAAFREFPHMAVLGCDSGIDTDDEIKWVGGGSLVSDKFILTAGHILISSYGNLRYAFLGSLDKTDMRGGDLYGIIQLIPHGMYTAANKHDDIALVKLNRRVTFSKYIRPICLPIPNIDPEDSIRLIAGWGEYEHNAGSTNLLQKAIISEVSGSECNASLRWPGFVWKDETMICARGWRNLYGISDTCQGDSGGPLMYRVTNRAFSCNYVIAGVVSWGGVCSRGYPASYTRVSAYLDWIVSTIWPEELKNATAGLDLDF